jgi:hypothetical protein
MSAKRRLLTRAELFTPSPITCATCRGPATAYPKGTFCPRCSPAWVEIFFAWQAACASADIPVSLMPDNGSEADTP